MAEEEQPKKRARTTRKAATSGAPTAKTERKTPRKQAAPRTRRAKAEEEKAAKEAAAATEREERAEMVKTLTNGSLALAAESWTDMASGMEAMAAADAVATLSREVGRAGADEVDAGARAMAVSQNVASQSLALEGLSGEDLSVGLALAGIAGQLRAVVAGLEGLTTPVLARFLDSRSRQLEQLAENVIQRAATAGALARTLADTSLAAAALADEELVEGGARLAASRREAARSEELADEGLDLLALGIAEAAEAEELEQEAGYVAAVDSDEPKQEAPPQG